MNSNRSCLTLLLVTLTLLTAGCSRKYYRSQANQDVAAIYAEKRAEEACTLPPLAGINVDPRSRFFDPSPEDCPALPVPVPQLGGYVLPGLVTGNPNQPPKRDGETDEERIEVIPESSEDEPDTGVADESTFDLDQSETTKALESAMVAHAKGSPKSGDEMPESSEVRLAELIQEATIANDRYVNSVADSSGEDDNGSDTPGLRIVPVPPTYWQQLPATCVPRMLEFELVRKEYRRSFPQSTTESMERMLSDAPRLTLPMITELASFNNRAIQTQKERLFRAALALTAQRYEYVLRPTRRGNGTDVFYTHTRFNSVTQNGLSIPTGVSVRKTTAMAGQFLASFANSVVLTFNGPQGFAANIGSDLVFDFQQTLFQRDVVFEGLTRAERQVIYAARDLIRAQRSLFVDLANDYYQILLANRAIAISSQDYFSNLRAFLQGKAEYLQAGRIPRVQVDQFEQNALGSRSSLVGSCNSLETSLDRLKLRIGLPPEMPINMDLGELDTLTTSDELTVTRQLVMRTRQTLIEATQTRLRDGNAAVNGATVLINRLRETLRVRHRIEGIDEETEQDRETERIGRRLALLETRLQSDQLDEDRTQQLKAAIPPPPSRQFARTVELIEARLLQARRAAAIREEDLAEPDGGDLTEAEVLVDQLTKTLTQWDAAITQSEFVKLRELVDKADKLLTETNALAVRKVGELLPKGQVELDNMIVRTVSDTVELVDQVATSGVGGLDEVAVEQDDAMLLALYQRLDLMNRRGELADDRRQIKLAADDLRAILDIRATQTLSANRDVTDFFDVTADGSTTRLGLALDTPLNRRIERNTYRAALIDYQAGRRALIESEDQIKFAIREDLRQLRLRRNQYEISVARAALAYERVVSTRLQLQLAVGNVVARDFLEAQQAYTSALTAVAANHISFIRGRIDLFFDTESIRLDANGYWTAGQEESLDLPPLPDFYDTNPNPYGRLPSRVRYSDEVRSMH